MKQNKDCFNKLELNNNIRNNQRNIGKNNGMKKD